MLPSFVIGLREGVEDALIVGIIASFLRQEGRRDALRPMWLGVAAAIAICLAVGALLELLDEELPQRQQEGLETIVLGENFRSKHNLSDEIGDVGAVLRDPRRDDAAALEPLIEILNSLDHITNGRIAFNVITSQRKADAQNYGFDELMEHGQRYDRMDEFMDVCQALWRSVEPDAFEWDRATGRVANPDKVRAINHVGRFFKVKGPLSVPPSPQIVPVLIQAGGSPRGTRTAARFVDHVFGARKPIPAMAKQRAEIDAALLAEGRDPSKVGVIWSTQVMVGETEAEAKRMRERLIDGVPREAVGAWLSHNTGFDMSTLLPRFTLRELNERIVAANASPVGFVAQLAQALGDDGEITLDEFMEHGLRTATSYATTVAGTAAQIADDLEERFEGSGSRGGFMLRHSQCEQIDMLHNIVDLLGSVHNLSHI